jgi:hypothetical protein
MNITVGIFDNSNNPIVGDSPNTSIKIQRHSDNFYYDWGDGTFKNAGFIILSDTLVEISPLTLPGYYKKDVNESGWNDDFYSVQIQYTGVPLQSSTNQVMIYDGEIVGKYDMLQKINRILGLVHENIFIDQTVYDDNENLISARVRIYSVAGSVGSDNDVISEYRIDVNATGAGKFATWSQFKV